ncbi:MAG TPA: EamA family transporter [Thermomonospora sp.]|nr:EamA family transporter [Thermomonospora sp.]
MVTVLALAAAFGYGVADFLGGAASRRTAVLRVLMVSMPAGVVSLTVASLLAGGTPTAAGVTWGAVSGVTGAVGMITFYRALARGPMSVVAPVSALTAAVLPVAVGTLHGERLDTGVLTGVALCVIAIGLVSMEESRPASPTGSSKAPWRRTLDSGPVMAGVSGLAFGGFFVLLHQAGDDSGLWPTTAARLAGFTVILTTLTLLTLHRRSPTAVGPAPASATDSPVAPHAVGTAPSAASGNAAPAPVDASVPVAAPSRPVDAVGRGAGASVLAADASPSVGDGVGADDEASLLLADTSGTAAAVGAGDGSVSDAAGGAVGGVGARWGLGGVTLVLAVCAGVLDALANALYFVAAREGLLSLAAVLTSLYPAITVLLARIFYSERLRVIQRVGLAVAVAGVTLVTVG